MMQEWKEAELWTRNISWPFSGHRHVSGIVPSPDYSLTHSIMTEQDVVLDNGLFDDPSDDEVEIIKSTVVDNKQ